MGRAHNIGTDKDRERSPRDVPESGGEGSRQKAHQYLFSPVRISIERPLAKGLGQCTTDPPRIAKQDLGHPGTIHIDRHPGIKRREFKPCREEQRAGGATSPSFCRVSFPPQVFFRIFLPARGETAPIAYPAVRARTPHSGTAADPWGGIPGLASSPGLKGCWGPVRGGGCTPAR